MTISCIAAEDILLSRISSIEGSIVVVRKLNTCEAVLFSGIMVVVIPLLLLILSADGVICNIEIKCYRRSYWKRLSCYRHAQHTNTSRPVVRSACADRSRDIAPASEKESTKPSVKLNNIKSIPSVVGYLQCRWLIFPFRYLMCLWMSQY